MLGHKTIFIFTLITLSSCSQFHTGRSYLSEMGHDDSRFFKPTEDFPIVAGDTGRYWNSEEEQKERTPSSEYDLAQERRNRSLRQELHDLESTQSEDNLKLYEKYKNKLSTVSERIYFLELLPFERKDYLSTRGFIEESRSPASYFGGTNYTVKDQHLAPGMSKNDVVASWGKPARVETSGNPLYENERWLYNTNGASKYIYFESGSVQGWE